MMNQDESINMASLEPDTASMAANTTSDFDLDELNEEHRRLSLLLRSIQSDVESISKNAPSKRSNRMVASKRKTTHEESSNEIEGSVTSTTSQSNDYDCDQMNGLTSSNKPRSKTSGSRKKSMNRMNTIMEVDDNKGENDVIMIKVADKKQSGTVKDMLTKANNIYMVSTRDPTKFVRLENVQDFLDKPRIEYKNVNESLKALTNIKEVGSESLEKGDFMLCSDIKLIDTKTSLSSEINSKDVHEVSQKVKETMDAIKSHLKQNKGTDNTYVCKKRLSSEEIIDDVLNNETMKTSSITLYPENVASVRNNVMQRIKRRGYRSIKHVGSKEETRYEKIILGNDNNSDKNEDEKQCEAKNTFYSEKTWKPSFPSLNSNKNSFNISTTSSKFEDDNETSDGIFARPDTPYCHNDVIDDLMTRRNEIVFSFQKSCRNFENIRNQEEKETMETTEREDTSDNSKNDNITENEDKNENENGIERGSFLIMDSDEKGIASFLDRTLIAGNESLNDYNRHTYVNLLNPDDIKASVEATDNNSREHIVLNEIAMIEKQISDISSGLNSLDLEISEEGKQKEKTIIEIWEEQEKEQQLKLQNQESKNQEMVTCCDDDDSDIEDSRRIEQLYEEIEQHQLKQQRMRLEQQQRQQELQQRIQQRNYHYHHLQQQQQQQQLQTQQQNQCLCHHYDCQHSSDNEKTDDSDEIIDDNCTILEEDYNSNNSNLRSCLKGTRRKYSNSSSPENNELSVKISTHDSTNHQNYIIEKLDSVVRYVSNSKEIKKIRTPSPTVRTQSPNPKKTNSGKTLNKQQHKQQQQQHQHYQQHEPKNSNKRFKPTTKETTKKQNRSKNNKSIRRCWCCGSTAHFLKACPQRRQNFRANSHESIHCNNNGGHFELSNGYNIHGQCKVNNRKIEQYSNYNGYYINQPYF